MNVVRARSGGIPGFILPMDQQEAGLGHHGREVVEVAAAVRLRDALAVAVADGDAWRS